MNIGIESAVSFPGGTPEEKRRRGAAPNKAMDPTGLSGAARRALSCASDSSPTRSAC